MSDAKNVSNTPLILGIVGFVSMIPGLICASTCGAFIDAASNASGQGTGMGGLITALTAIPAVGGFIGGFLSKNQEKLAGLLMVGSAVILLIPVILSGNWFFGLITIACYLIGGVLSLQKK